MPSRLSRTRRVLLRVLATGLAAGAARPSLAQFKEPLKTPAMQAPRAASAPMTAMARVGRGPRVVAVGWRGVVIVSDDRGATWRQAAVPVRADLTAVTFLDEKSGWAVGNDGVVLRTGDGGLTWTLVLDGFRVAALMVEKYERLAAERPDDAAVGAALRDAKGYAAQAPARPFLDVFFEDPRSGYVVGNFNLILRTQDGGSTWDPQSLETDNPDGLNLYVGRRFADRVLLAGELGLLRLRAVGEQRFQAVRSPYEGTLFAAAGTPGAWVLAGLRGHAIRSTDAGRSWAPIDFATPPTTFVDAATLDAHSLVLLTGDMLYLSRDDGATFRPVPLRVSMRCSAVLPLGAGTVLVAGLQGVRKVSLP